MRYAEISRILPALLCTLALAGCSSKPVSEAPGAAPGTAQATPAAVLPPIDPAVQSRYDQALQAMENGQDDSAQEILLALREAHPGYAGIHTNLGLIYLRKQDKARAEAALQKAIELNGKSAVARTHLGILYRQQGRFADAEQQYLGAVQQDPNYPLAHLNLAILYDVYLLKLDAALQHYDTYQKLLPQEDEQVTKWLVDLKRRLNATK